MTVQTSEERTPSCLPVKHLGSNHRNISSYPHPELNFRNVHVQVVKDKGEQILTRINQYFIQNIRTFSLSFFFFFGAEVIRIYNKLHVFICSLKGLNSLFFRFRGCCLKAILKLTGKKTLLELCKLYHFKKGLDTTSVDQSI